MRRLESAL
uniref:Uncharacterized protein n=1 Tax=Anguilla anguilla TaxID=7936 RepID=A0A0E9R1V2_ANGAN